MSLNKKFAQILEKFISLEQKLNDGFKDQKDFASASKEYSDMEPIVIKIKKLESYFEQIEQLNEMIEGSLDDQEILEMAKEDLGEIKKQIPIVEEELKVMLLPKDVDDDKGVILEIRAGTGGEEAALFATNLLRMYKRYAENKSWKFEEISLSQADQGGIKEVCINITGQGVFARLKFESGVHRVQRIPTTESNGRIHTSAATVAVLPEAKEVDIQIEEKDLRIDVYRASGAGGQHVNTTDSAVRITHIPTGVVVAQQDEKSQHKNKAKAMKILRARIYEAERIKEQEKMASTRKNQVGSGDRSERIRTYNYPQTRVTDHRINLTLYKLDAVMEGELDEIIDSLIADDVAKALAAN